MKTHKRLRILEGFLNIAEMSKVINVNYLKLWRATRAGRVSPPTHQYTGKKKYYRIEDIERIRIEYMKNNHK